MMEKETKLLGSSTLIVAVSFSIDSRGEVTSTLQDFSDTNNTHFPVV
jgi:hypothetical protein